MKHGNIIEKMSLEEKASLCVGKDYWNTQNIERLNIKSIRMSDGPHGLRVQRGIADNLGINESEVSICFPSLATLANSWDKKMAYKLGNALGEEATTEGIDIVLGPAINIKRTPLCGRNFEYFSEDPYLTGSMGVEYIKGLQKNNVGACVKHFAVNNQENRRRTINAVIDERTLREIYLKAFEIIVKNSKPWSIMSAYNKVNGTYCTENKTLIDILKKEWGFDGIIISDWGAENDRVEGLIAGHELEMPGGRGNGVNEIIDAVKSGKVSEEYLNEIVDNILDVVFRAGNREKANYDVDKHHQIALEIAENSIVLLKNENKILPLKKNKIALIGDMAKNPRYQGAGSSKINPYVVENAYDSFKDNGINFDYAKGYNRTDSKEDEVLIKEAVELAKENEVVVLFVGLTEIYESEGMDRLNLELPKNQIRLIEEIGKVNNNIVVVLAHGAPITMDWQNKVKAIITGYLGGEAGEKAIVNCILGKINPSGKLAETYPLRLEDTPCYKNYPGTEVSVEYQESIYVGYRYYDTNKVNVLYPFGYGLSYTEFEYSDLQIKVNDYIEVTFTIKNVGEVEGKEIAQIYISQNSPRIFKPNKELKAFEKVELKPNEEKNITVKLSKEDFAYYNVEARKWSVEEGNYRILIGKSSSNIVLEKEIFIKSDDASIKQNYPEVYKTADVQHITDKDFEILLGHKIPRRHISIDEISQENTLEQIKDTKIGKVIYDNQIKKMNNLFEEQDVHKATRVMMDMQKPLKKFYDKKNSKYTKEMVEELIYLAKNDLYDENCEFLIEYLK